MTKLIGYAPVSTRQQSTDRQQAELLAAGVRRDDLYVDRGDGREHSWTSRVPFSAAQCRRMISS